MFVLLTEQKQFFYEIEKVFNSLLAAFFFLLFKFIDFSEYKHRVFQVQWASFPFLFCLRNSDIIALLRPSQSPTLIKKKKKSSLWNTFILFSFLYSTSRNSRINLLISWSNPFLPRSAHGNSCPCPSYS